MNSVLKAYLFVFDDNQAPRDVITDGINRINEIVNWYAFLPSGICVISGLDTNKITSEIRSEFPNLRFLITRLEAGKKNGWLPEDVWPFMNDPKLANAAKLVS